MQFRMRKVSGSVPAVHLNNLKKPQTSVSLCKMVRVVAHLKFHRMGKM